MNKRTNYTVALFKQVALLPVLAGMVFLFSTKVYAQRPAQAKPQTKTENKVQALDTSKPKPPTVKRIVLRHIPLGPGATEEQLAEYDNVISRIVSTGVTKDGKTITRINSKGVDREKIGGIYKLMNETQRATRDPAVGEMMVPLGPPAKKHPTAAQLQAWTDAAKYGIWIDDKRVDNSELQKYQSSDFDLYYESKLTKNAINYGKHYYQVDLCTAPYYKKKLSQVSVTEMTHTSN